MGAKRSKEIRANFSRYKRIKELDKNLKKCEFVMIERKGASRYECCEKDLKVDDECLILRCDAKKGILRTLHIQLFCKSLQSLPCYRFESNGDPHMNRAGYLKGRLIPTPHFHEFDENGYEIAYQTKELLDSSLDLLKSREAVMSHFCKVHNINLESAIKITPSEILPVEDSEEDFLKGIKFND
jgi:hypothetical protein